MTARPKVSVIVPVYNAGRQLRKCLDALVYQTLEEIEFVVILDAPTDGSDRIVEEYAARDPRFVVLRNEENLHIGESRNRGLQVARGEYIGFSDHDDDCDPTMFEKLYRAAASAEADVCASHLLFRFQDHDELYPFPSPLEVDEATAAIILSPPLEKDTPSYGNIKSVWLHLFRASFLREHHIRFVDTRRVSMEDIFFCAEVYLSRPKVTLCPQPLYHWWQDAASTSHKYAYYSVSTVRQFLEALHEVIDRKGRLQEFGQELFMCSVMRLYTAYRKEWAEHRFGAFARFRRGMASSESLRKVFLRFDRDALSRLPWTKRLFYHWVLKPAILSRHGENEEK